MNIIHTLMVKLQSSGGFIKKRNTPEIIKCGIWGTHGDDSNCLLDCEYCITTQYHNPEDNDLKL
jgi:hypothetical protein